MAKNGDDSSYGSLEEYSEIEDQTHCSVSYARNIHKKTTIPFANKITTFLHSLIHSNEYKPYRPLIAPPTFVLGNEYTSSVSSIAKFTSWPSLLSTKTDKWENADGYSQTIIFHGHPRIPVDFNTTQRQNIDKVKISPLSNSKTYRFIPTEEASMYAFGKDLQERKMIEETSVNEVLSEAIQMIHQSRQQVKRKFDEVDSDEGSSTVLQIKCKLYAVNKDTIRYQEWDRGILKLTDKTCCVVTQDRTILSTKVWAGMEVEKHSLKAVRLTAIDTVFLVVATRKDAEHLYNALHSMVTILKSQKNTNKPLPRSKKLRPSRGLNFFLIWQQILPPES
ncbi:RANBP3 [Cordylochernes scorpioides]|uniref:RANBP3 n=1 Tax=Cordylochernes scorpioides TaxID=51811 RepID=A0ABY6L6V2_9ARAC|nr:RANBP3 [Cordylochernes scorpioides]